MMVDHVPRLWLSVLLQGSFRAGLHDLKHRRRHCWRMTGSTGQLAVTGPLQACHAKGLRKRYMGLEM